MKQKKKGIQILYQIVRVIAPFLVILLWYYGSESGKINRALLPSPGRVWNTLILMLQNGRLLSNLSVSAIRVLRGFAIGASAGLILGILMGLSKWVNGFLGSLVGILRPIPMIAWLPLLILWLGIGDGSKNAIIAIGTFWSVLLNTISGIQSVDPKLKEVAAILEKKPGTVLLKVILPAALPGIFTGIRLGMGTAWSCVVAAEMIAASKGIGYMIMYARELSQPDVLLVGMLTIGLVGLLIDTGILKLQKHLLKWNVDQG
jgi:sulfonate transport system permease protein